MREFYAIFATPLLNQEILDRLNRLSTLNARRVRICQRTTMLLKEQSVMQKFTKKFLAVLEMLALLIDACLNIW
jgi:hypothetical protein